eukprot:TRINITY_DN80613_c0_g1_i1.p2 TRINITY_DN80613_c0_g1~~TRINITY_DN80613_c0_g1_i1.p2  ORF type:complete len:292 (+),score=21.65 TRINITY_DN80613_c0_g1_i1:197-1072(+)
MTALDDLFIRNILRTNDNGILYQKEDSRIEFKINFDRNSKEAKAKYLKELAALHNFEGGYLIFGIDDKTGELKGLGNFENIDNADISNDINNYFSPHFHVISRAVTISDKVIFVIYVSKREGIPTVCIKDHQEILKEATIYWRYSGQSSPIEAGDLISLLHSLRGEEVERLVSVKKTELKAQYKPDLRHNGAQSGMESVKVKLENHGATATINSLTIIEGEVKVTIPASFPRTIRKEDILLIQISTTDGTVANSKVFTLKLDLEDEVGNKYYMLGSFRGAQGGFKNLVEAD